MSPILPGLRRAIAVKLIPQAIKSGVTRTGFLHQLRTKGLGYRKTTFLTDWRKAIGEEERKGLARYVRKDRIPSPRVMVEVDWELEKGMEYMYKVKTWGQLRPGEPLTERGAIILSDKPLTPLQVEERVALRWVERREDYPEELIKTQLEMIYHKKPGITEFLEGL